MKILVADDEKEICRTIKIYLEHNNYTVDTVYDGEEALECINSSSYDLVILDVMMPKMDGIQVLKTLRNQEISIPVIMLSAKTELEDRIAGLDNGADDYIAKPFYMKELLSRVKALLRRSNSYVTDILRYGNLELNCSSYEIYAGNITKKLINKEFQILELFVRNPGIVFSTENLMEKIWSWDSSASINVVWTNIANLRRKLSDIGADIAIQSIRGVGYKLEEKR